MMYFHATFVGFGDNLTGHAFALGTKMICKILSIYDNFAHRSRIFGGRCGCFGLFTRQNMVALVNKTNDTTIFQQIQ